MGRHSGLEALLRVEMQPERMQPGSSLTISTASSKGPVPINLKYIVICLMKNNHLFIKGSLKNYRKKRHCKWFFCGNMVGVSIFRSKTQQKATVKQPPPPYWLGSCPLQNCPQSGKQVGSCKAFLDPSSKASSLPKLVTRLASLSVMGRERWPQTLAWVSMRPGRSGGEGRRDLPCASGTDTPQTGLLRSVLLNLVRTCWWLPYCC